MELYLVYNIYHRLMVVTVKNAVYFSDDGGGGRPRRHLLCCRQWNNAHDQVELVQ